MADIFISYSSKDREQADLLTELLSSAGLSVWIDKSGIAISTSWSKEIVQAIDGCKAFIVLLSPNSILSNNVVKEVSLAAEQRKKILPLDLEPVELSEDLRYHLAGIQRAPMTNIDAVIRALAKLGLEATRSPSITLVKETDSRKSLMILPFEDLSPTGDNGWFADGIVSEMISALSNVKSLRVTDTATTKDFKRYQGTLPNYAKEMGVRYFVSGDVRKFGDNIKITSRLLDIETGDHLWQDSMKGTMDDIFDIQEKVAEKVVEGLKVHLASDEKKKLAERGTDNAEAYELFLKAAEYFNRNTKEGAHLARQLLDEAIRLDPKYASAYQFLANVLTDLYRLYDRNPTLIDTAERLCKEALRLRPDMFGVYHPLSQICMHRGQLEQAEQTVREYIQKDPKSYSSHFALGFLYAGIGRYAEAVAPFEEVVRLKPDYLPAMFNLVVNSYAAGDTEKSAHWAALALPNWERHLKLHPDDEGKRVQYAGLLFYSGRNEDAHTAAVTQLANLKDGTSLFNTACLYGLLDDKIEALRTLRKAIEAGFSSTRHLREFLTDGKEGVVQLEGTAEYEEVKRMVDAIEAEKAAITNV